MRKRGLCCRQVSVRLSVCLSVTLVYCIQTAEDIVNIFLGPVADSRFFDPERRYQIPRGTPSAGAQNTRENLRFSIEIAVYLENGTRKARGCYET